MVQDLINQYHVASLDYLSDTQVVFQGRILHPTTTVKALSESDGGAIVLYIQTTCPGGMKRSLEPEGQHSGERERGGGEGGR